MSSLVNLDRILRQAVEQLPERCRQLITLLFYSGNDLGYDEIARRLEIPRDSMGPTRARCLPRPTKTCTAPRIGTGAPSTRTSPTVSGAPAHLEAADPPA